MNPETLEGGFPRRLRAAGPIAVAAAVVGSVGLTLYAGRRLESPVLLVVFTLWVLTPFVALGLANAVSKHWSVLTQATLHGLMLILALGSLAIYSAQALGPRAAPNALVFVGVPPASLLLIAIVLPIAALVSRRPSREGTAPNRAVDLAFKGVAALTMLGVLGIGALMTLLWLEHRTKLTLPTPTGSFAVGREISAWADDVALDSLAPVRGTKRELLVWIWYPSAAGQSVTMNDYVPAQLRAADDSARGGQTLLGLLMSKFLTRDFSKVQSHTTRNADISPQQRSYPVVIMRAGASAGVLNYSTLAEDLASHGYVVVGFDAPYRTSSVVFPDGRVIASTPENNPELCAGQEARCINRLLAAWTTDMKFVLDRLERLNASKAPGRFTGRLDMTRVGVFGHSFGGATAAQFCHEDSRCKAGVDVDGALHGSVIQTGLRKPFMFLLSDHGDSSDPVSRQILANIQSVYDRLPPDGRVRIAIRGANHFFFSDDPALLKSRILVSTLRMLGVVRIDGRRQLGVTSHCLHRFFDEYVKGSSASPLEISSPLYPEIQVLDGSASQNSARVPS